MHYGIVKGIASIFWKPAIYLRLFYRFFISLGVLDVFVQDAGLLLVLVDLDIAGRVFILNKQQGGGQGNGQRGEQCEQHFENFHGFKPPW